MGNPVRIVLTALFGFMLASLAGCGDDPVPVSESPATGEGPQVTSEGGKRGSTSASAEAANYTQSGSTRKAASKQPVQAARSGELTDPSVYDMYWVYVDWTGMHPDYGKAAEQNVGRSGNTYDNQMVNEFNRAGFIEKERARLESLGASSRDIGFITTNIGGRLGDYDPGYGEFYVDPLSPGSSISFSSPQKWLPIAEAHKGINFLHVKIRLTNALDGYVWKLSPEKAQEVINLIEREGNPGRQIYARVRLQIEGVAVAGDLPEMNARVLSYSLHTEKGTKLAEFDL